MMKKTYKTEHPTITEISIGDKFVTESGEIVTFVEYDESLTNYPIITNKYNYSLELTFWFKQFELHPYNIKYKIPSLKDKIYLL